MKKRRNKNSIILSMLGVLVLLGAAGCSAEQNRDTTVGGTEQSQETGAEDMLTADDPESPDHEETQYYLSESIPAENFSYTIEGSEAQGDQIFTIQNISDQDYSYVQADILFYDGNSQLVDYYAGLSMYNLFAGSDQILRFVPNISAEQYDHVEVLFSGDRMTEAETVDPAGVQIEEQAKVQDGRIVAKCVNGTGTDLSTVSFRIDYFKGENKVATGYTEASMLAADRVFAVSFEAPADGWYTPLPDDYYDNWEITVVRAVPLTAE